MPKIRNEEDLIKYTKLKLGSPMHNIEVTEEQFVILIDDSIDMFRRLNYGEGSIFSYGVFDVKKGKTQYNLRNVDAGFIRDTYGNNIPSSTNLDAPSWEDSTINIQSVLEIKLTGGGTRGINHLFSPDAMILNNGSDSIVNNLFNAPTASDGVTTNQSGTIGGGAGQVYDYMMPLTNFVQSSAYLETFNKIFKRQYEAIWRAQEGILNIYPTPDHDDTAMIIYWAHENKRALFNNPLFKEYFLLVVQKQWGANLKKFTHTLAGGGEIDAQGLYDSANDALVEILEQIRLESEPPGFFIG